jgi:pyruvate,water dikinase
LDDYASAEGTVWTRGYSDDYWNDSVSPLFFELLGDQLTQIVNVELNAIMGYSKPSDKLDQLLLLHRSHVYFNLEVLKRKVEYEIPPMLRNDDILNYFEDGDGPYGKETMKKQPFHMSKRLLAEIRVMLYDRNGSITKTASAYDKWSKKQFQPFANRFNQRFEPLYKNHDVAGLLDLAQELDQVMIGHFRLVRYGIPVHNIGINLIAQYLLARFIGKKDATEGYLALLSGLEHKTSQTNDALFHLAELIQASPLLREQILSYPSNLLLMQLRGRNDPEIRMFLAELDKFFIEYGFRGFTREPYYPRWQEAPEHVFNILKSMVRDQRQQQTLKISSKGPSKEDVARQVKSTTLGWIKWQIFSKVLSYARKYIIFREEQRFHLDQWITMNRKIYLAVGDAFYNRDVLDEARDIFFMKRAEIQQVAKNQYSPSELAAIKQSICTRKEEFLENEHCTPVKFLRGNQEQSEENIGEGTATEFQGIPASRGVVSGPVRVLSDIDDIWKVRSGEVLVVPRTDPGWTPVFRLIGGLITETGGLLSHGAVVSREYGIPAVTNIPNACRLFKTGQTVTIDGSKGTVTIQ